MFVMMLHNALPHVHHFHEEIEGGAEIAEHHDHSHEHHHHSDEQGSNEEEQDFSLSSYLEDHSHSFHSHHFHEYFIPTNCDTQVFKDKVSSIVAILAKHGCPPEYKDQNLSGFSLFKDNFYSNPFPFYYSLRGPPSLG